MRYLALLLLVMPIRAQDFDTASWTQGVLYLRSDAEDYFYFFADEESRAVAVSHKKRIGEALILEAAYIREADGTCWTQRPIAKQGATKMQTAKSDCHKFDLIMSWFLVAEKGPPSQPLEKNLH